MKKETTRLHFSEEDLENAAVSRAAGKAERAADRADAAKARLPTKGKLRDEKEKTAFYGEQLRFGKKDFSGAGEEIVSPGSPQAALPSMRLPECSVRGHTVRSRNMRMTMQAYRPLTRVKRLWRGQGGPLITPATAGS